MSKTIPAHNFCNSVFDGTHDTPKPCENGHPLILSKNIQRNSINLQDTYNISEEDYNAINARSKVSQWDILFSMIGTVGFVYLEKSKDIPYAIKNMGVFSTKDELKAKWLYYYLQTNEAKSIILNYLNGAVQKFLPLGFLREFPVREMPRNAKEIISVLENIDSKIDNNNAIAAELEGMAKDLYDYWFVQFDFPDENGKPYKSSGGKMVWNDELKREIPEGWENGIVSDLGTVVTGGTPSTGCAEYFAKSKSGHAWATPKDLSNLNGRYFYHGEADITDAGLKNSAGNIMPKGSVLFTTRAPIGYIAITANEACTNQGFKSIIPAKKFGTEFVFQTLKMLTPQMQRVGVGSTFKEVSKDVFSHQSIVIPSVNLLKKYAALTLDIAEKIRNTQEENVELTSLRDFLLPMLMNGQVKVKGA